MKIPFLRKFLFCISLQAGCKIIGFVKAIFQLIVALILLISYLFEFRYHAEYMYGIGPLFVKLISLNFIEAFFASLLLHGVFKRKPVYVKIWIVVQLATLFQNVFTFLAVLTIHLVGYPSEHLQLRVYSGAVLMVLDVYTTLVVYSYYRDEYYRDRQGNIIENEDIISTLDLTTVPL